MKHILLFTLTFILMNTQVSAQQMYGKVDHTSIDLYQKPYQCAKKKEDFYKKGDMIEIVSCDRYQWCKTTNGYVKKNLLILPKPLVNQDKLTVEKTFIKEEKTTLFKTLQTVKKPVETETIETEIVETPNDLNTTQEVLQSPYDKYFTGDSARVL